MRRLARLNLHMVSSLRGLTRFNCSLVRGSLCSFHPYPVQAPQITDHDPFISLIGFHKHKITAFVSGFVENTKLRRLVRIQ